MDQDFSSLAKASRGSPASGSSCTPGPWVMDRYGALRGSNGHHVTVSGAGIGLSGGVPDAEAIANGHVVRAAWDILDALKSAEEMRQTLCAMISEAVYEADELKMGDARLATLAHELDSWMGNGMFASYRDEFQAAIAKATGGAA